MRATVFCGVSFDGFLARPDGAFDWLPTDNVPNGYDQFIASIDTVVIGRKTFEVVMAFGGWGYGKMRVVVLSSAAIDLAKPRERGAVIEQMGGSPAEVWEQLEASGARGLWVDGGITIQRFLAAGLIDRMIVTRVPVLIGEGIPLFGKLPHDVRLAHVSTKPLPNGLVQSEYNVLR